MQIIVGYFLRNQFFRVYLYLFDLNVNVYLGRVRMRPRRPHCARMFLIYAILHILICIASAYGTPTDGNFMSSVKTLFFGNETVIYFNHLNDSLNAINIII